MSFCDFCNCKDCQTGRVGTLFKLKRAQTSDNKWICDVCYKYDQCSTSESSGNKIPCSNLDCEHRPKLISNWSELDDT